MTQSKLELSIALSENENTRAVLDGRIAPDGIKLYPTALHPSEMFWRQLKFAEFDVSEMSMSSLTIATSQGPTPWVMLPVFTTREFFHLRILVRVASGIEKPADLQAASASACRNTSRPRRSGAAACCSTSSACTRARWNSSWSARRRRATAARPASSRRRASPSIAFRSTTNIGEMMVRGELDATLLYLTHANLVDRSRIDLSKDNRFRPLFDRAAEARRYFAKTGIYQINHGMVIRRSIFERYPWAALNIYNAFAAARAEVIRARDTALHRHYEPGLIGDDVRTRARHRHDGLWRQGEPQGARDHHAIRPRAGPDAAPRRARRAVRAEHDGLVSGGSASIMPNTMPRT